LLVVVKKAIMITSSPVESRQDLSVDRDIGRAVDDRDEARRRRHHATRATGGERRSHDGRPVPAVG
jgi:hypothetical protein